MSARFVDTDGSGTISYAEFEEWWNLGDNRFDAGKLPAL